MNAPDQLRTAEGAVVETRTLDSDFERLLQAEVKPRDLLLDDSSFDKMLKIAEIMASGRSTVPKHLQGSLGDCMAVVTQAMLWGMNPFAVAQKTHVVNGALGYEAQLVNAVVCNSGAIRGHFHYEYKGDECRVGAVLRGDDAITFGEWLSASTVKVKNSSLWTTNPKQQLGYLQVKNWARAYAPGAILGVYSVDELDEIPAEPAAKRGPQRKSETNPPASETKAPAGETQAHAAETKPAASAPAPAAAATKPATSGGIDGSKIAYLRNKLKAAQVEEQTICDRFQVASIELLTAEQFDKAKSELLAL